MLRNRSRAVTSKQALMADHSTQASPTKNYTNPIPSFLDSPRFKVFTLKSHTETEAIKSPTSILDNKTFFPFSNPFVLTRPNPPKLFSPRNSEPKGIGLAILDAFTNDNQKEDNRTSCCEPTNRKVLFGTELRVQIPPPPPTDFGIKTRNSHLSPTFTSPDPGIHTKVLPVTEMELSEDYTCVISHGPNPRTTHIFHNCVVESYSSPSAPDDTKPNKPTPTPTPQSFLSFCHTCKKNLEQKVDIYIYRGDKAFCSPECRSEEMVLEGEDN